MGDDGDTVELSGEFRNALQDFSARLAGEDDFLVVGHHDADGITATAITVDVLRKLGKTVEHMNIKQLDSTTIGEIKGAGAATPVLVDMGSGHLTLLESNDVKDYYIIDHHQPEGETERQINPHLFGFDGGIDVAGAGMAYLVAKSLGHAELAHIAVVGALGDMQDSGGRLHSINRLIMEDAVGQGTLKVKHDLRLFGRQSRTLTQMLAYATDPVLPSLTGYPAACADFMQAQGIPLKNPDGSWRNYVDLSRGEREKLTTALYIHLLDMNTPEFVIQRMIGEVFTLLNEEKKTELRDGKEFATVLNACGRQSRPDLGVGVCLGDRGSVWEQARKLLEVHRRTLREGIEYLTGKGVESRSNLYFFDSGGAIKESIIGVVAGMAYGARIIPPDKPVLAFAVDRDDGSMLKVSARANWGLIRRGLHLGEAMRDCSARYGGEGGGHDIAAGARIKKDQKGAFIELVDETFGRQLKGQSGS